MNRQQRRAQKKLVRKKVRLKDLKEGPLRHRTLSSALLFRIRALYEQLKEHQTDDLASWIEGFQRDVHPEREVAIWEAMSRALAAFQTGRNLGPAQRSEAFQTVLSYSMHADQKSFEHLSTQEGRELLALVRTELGG